MPWNAGSFTRIHNWSADAASGIDILASRMDQEDDNFRDGISSCLNVSGENTLLEDVSMGGKKWLLCGDALLQNQYPTAGQVQLGKLNYGGESTGSANTYECNVAEGGVIAGLSTWVPGFTVLFMPHQTNDGPATLNVNGTAPAVIICAGFNLQGEEIVDGHICQVVWNGSVWELLSPPQVRLTNAELFTPLGVKGYLTSSIVDQPPGGANIQWTALQWSDEVGFMPGGPPSDTFVIPPMPDTPDNEARFNIDLSVAFYMTVFSDTVVQAYIAEIFISQNNGVDFFPVPAGQNQVVVAGDLADLGQNYTVHANFQMEMKTTDQIRFLWRFNSSLGSSTVNRVSILGDPNIISSTWCSITRMG